MTHISLGWVEVAGPSMQGMSSRGTLALGLSTVKLSCLNSGFPVFSLSSTPFFRLPSSFFSPPPVCLGCAPCWPTLRPCSWVLVEACLLALERSTSVLPKVNPNTFRPVLDVLLSWSAFSWRSRSCFSDEETGCLNWLLELSGATGSTESSKGSCGRVLRLRSECPDVSSAEVTGSDPDPSGSVRMWLAARLAHCEIHLGPPTTTKSSGNTYRKNVDK